MSGRSILLVLKGDSAQTFHNAEFAGINVRVLEPERLAGFDDTDVDPSEFCI